ncbi:heterokaryon incompatibility protein-domain-containing protein [Lenzites betulinus]|nr:heterokaryon incompatibility protein-domain-containing protein [Lenzites betulinus]
MPRFLNTSTGEFVWEVDPKTIVYAILSHTWRPDAEGGEQSYQDVLKLQAAVRQGTASSDSAPPYPTVLDHPDLSTKIKEACRVAREAGYGLLWLDSCCIDKSSSAELSEAINSMFEWYRFADMCYAYLEDFPDGEDPTDKSSCFRKCRWFRRGWTLQELIAPEQVFFLTRTWRFFGTKLALASVLKEITVVDFDILAGRAPLDSVSVAQRMSWAATRETTRVEDQAYCLLGLFDVHMPAIYGEGKNAFLRLQDEIIKTIPDQSIFAWGSSGVLKVADSGHEIGLTNTFPLTHAPGLLASDTWSFAPSAVRLVQTLIKVRTSMTSSAYGPRFPQPPYEAPDLLQHLYRTYNRIAPLSPADFIKRIGKPSNSPSPSLHCVFTPQGVQLRLFCINVGSIPPGGPSLPFLSCTTCRKENRYLDLLALLQCEDAEGRLIALPLCRPSSSVPGFKAYTVGWHRPLPFPCQDCCGGPPLYAGNVSHSVRLVPEVLTMLLPYLESEPREVLILRQYSDPPRLKSLQRSFSHFHETLNTPIDQIELAPGCDDRLRTLGFAISDVQIEHDTADQKIIVMASLVYPRLPPFRQVISVRLALETMVTSPSMTYSVRNLIPLAPDPDNDDITAASAGTPPRPQSPSDSVSSGAHWVCINEIRDMLPLTSYARILASVDLTIDDYTGPKEARGLSGSQRILRIVVEQPTLSPKGRDLPRIVLCPSFELSGSFVQPPAPTNNTCRRPTVNLERTHTTGVELGPGALLIAPGDGGEHDGTCNILNDIVAIQGYMGNMLGGTRSQARVLRPAHDAIVKAHELDEIVGLMDSLSQWSHHVDARIANEGGLLEALRSIRRSRLNTGDSDDQDAEIAERLQLEEFEDVLSSSTRTRGDVSRGAATVTAPFGTSILPRTTSTQFSAEESSAGKREVPPNPMETLKRKLEVAARNAVSGSWGHRPSKEETAHYGPYSYNKRCYGHSPFRVWRRCGLLDGYTAEVGRDST